MRRMTKACFSLFKIKASEQLQYRMAALSGMTVSTFVALTDVIILMIFFTHGTNTTQSINGMTLTKGINYIWVGQLLVMLQLSGIDGDLLNKITNGDIGIELCRPLDLYWHWFARTAASTVNAFALRGGLVVVCGGLLTIFGAKTIGLGLPFSAINFLLFCFAILNAFIFAAAFSMFITAIRIGISWGNGPINLIMVTGLVLGGGYLPLQLWPDFMQKFLQIQPFAAVLDTPARLYIGTYLPQDAFLPMLMQAVWIAIFIYFGKKILNHKLKNVVIQGG